MKDIAKLEEILRQAEARFADVCAEMESLEIEFALSGHDSISLKERIERLWDDEYEPAEFDLRRAKEDVLDYHARRDADWIEDGGPVTVFRSFWIAEGRRVWPGAKWVGGFQDYDSILKLVKAGVLARAP